MLFERVAGLFDRIEDTTSRNRMVELLAELFREVESQHVDKLIYLSQGRLGPPFERLEFGVGEALVRDALAAAAQVPLEDIRQRFAEQGEYGTVAQSLFAGRPAGDMTLQDVSWTLYRVATAGGKGAVAQKRDLLVDLLQQLGPCSAKHVLRIVLGKLRLGIGDPTVLEGLSFSRVQSKAERKPLERAYNTCSDLGLVARTYLEGGPEVLDRLHVDVGRPVRPALCERLNSAEAIIQKLGRCAVEPKIDGFRLQLHVDRGNVRAFSRNLEDISEMFPEIVEALGDALKDRRVIVDGEAAGYDPGTLEFLPFQVTVQRRRKYRIDELRQTLPLKLLAFDVLHLDSRDMTPAPYRERRQALVELLGQPIDFAAPGGPAAGPVVQPNDAREVERADELNAFFATAVERGQEDATTVEEVIALYQRQSQKAL